MRASRAGHAPAAGCGMCQHLYCTSNCVILPGQGQESSPDRSQCVTAAGAFPSGLGAVGRRSHAVSAPLGLRGSHESMGSGLASRKPVSSSTSSAVSPVGCFPLEVNTPQACGVGGCPGAPAPSGFGPCPPNPGRCSTCHLPVTHRGQGDRASVGASEGCVL